MIFIDHRQKNLYIYYVIAINIIKQVLKNYRMGFVFNRLTLQNTLKLNPYDCCYIIESAV